MVAHYVRDVGVGRSSRLFSTRSFLREALFVSRRGDKRLCLGALPLKYPAAPGLSPSDRPPPFALVRSFPIFHRITNFIPPLSWKSSGTCREKLHFLYRYPLFTPYLSRKMAKSSTGQPFFGLPVKKMAKKLYRSSAYNENEDEWTTTHYQYPRHRDFLIFFLH